jgi:hypothetical protein
VIGVALAIVIELWQIKMLDELEGGIPQRLHCSTTLFGCLQDIKMKASKEIERRRPVAQRERLAAPDRAQPLAPGAILQRAALAPQSLRPADILRLQQTLGNRAVAQMLSQPSPARSLVQAKLTVNAQGDEYEQEADRVAEEVMQEPAAQRAESENEDEEEDETPEVMTRRHPSPAAGGAFETGEAFEHQLQAARDQGQPLPPALRQDFETKFDADFSQVRVHTDARADQLNRSIQAVAFATGRDLFFQREAYDPDSYDGQKLIAHELTHVLQQRAGGGTALASIQRNSDGEAPKITSETTFRAPGGTDNTRKTVGVGEEVTFTGSASGEWAATSGEPLTLANGRTFEWTAPNRAEKPTEKEPEITLKVATKSATVKMTVVEPASIRAVKQSETTDIGKGTAGAGMQLAFNYNPMTVSFGNVLAKEVSGPATEIEGYYAEHYTADGLWHEAGIAWFLIKENNEWSAEDEAFTEDPFTPYKKGKFRWDIPNRFRVKSEWLDGKQFTTVTQAVSMDDYGTVTITKAGASVTRRKDDP